ncbi:hypothetical protein GCM10009548_70780 [Streptomyces malaysiensis subsp. malaysiensis]
MGHVVRSERLDVADGEVPGMVHDDVELACLREDRGDCRLDGLLRLNIQRDRAKADAFTGGELP